MLGEPDVVGVDRTDRAALDIGAFGGDHRIADEAHRNPQWASRA